MKKIEKFFEKIEKFFEKMKKLWKKFEKILQKLEEKIFLNFSNETQFSNFYHPPILNLQARPTGGYPLIHLLLFLKTLVAGWRG